MIHTRDTKGEAQSFLIRRCLLYCRAQRRRATIRWLPITEAQAITRSQSREASQLVHEVHYARIAQVYRSVHCRDDQLSHGESHALRVIASAEDITEVARRNYELDLGDFGMWNLLADVEVG